MIKCVNAITTLGYQAVVDKNGNGEFGELAKKELAGDGYVKGFTCGGKVLEELRSLAQLLRDDPSDFFDRAFGADASDAPFAAQDRKPLLLLGLGQCIANGGELFLEAASLYLSLLLVPGALSYQMFYSSLLELVVRKGLFVDKVKNPSVGQIAIGMAKVMAIDGFVSRIVDCMLLEKSLEFLLFATPVCPDADRAAILKALIDLSQTSLNDEDESDEMEVDDEETETKQQPTNGAGFFLEKKMRDVLQSMETDEQTRNWIIELLAKMMGARSPKELEIVQIRGVRCRYNGTTVRMAQHLCVDIGDKIGPRALAASTIPKIFACIEDRKIREASLFRFCKFLHKLSQSKKTCERSCAAEVSGAILEKFELNEDMLFGLHDILIHRARDKLKTVAQSAIRGMGKMLQSPFIDDREIFEPVVETLSKYGVSHESCTVRSAAIKMLRQFLCTKKSFQKLGQGQMIVKSCMAICKRARDVSLIVRKAVIDSMGEFISVMESELSTSIREAISDIWPQNVFPLIYDTEKTAENDTRKAMEKVVFQGIIRWHETRGTDEVVWTILSRLQKEQRTCLQRGFFTMPRAGIEAISKPLVKALLCAISEGNVTVQASALMVLDLIAGGGPKGINGGGSSSKEQEFVQESVRAYTDPGIILDAWAQHFGETPPSDDEAFEKEVQIYILDILMGVSGRIPAQEANEIAASLFELVHELEVEPDMIKKCLNVMVCFCQAKSSGEAETYTMISAWGSRLAEKCKTILGKIHTSRKVSNSEQAVNTLFLVGELAILGLDPNAKCKGYIPIDEDLVTLAMGILSSKDVDDFLSLRTHALVATGKVCLRDEKSAKRATNMLVRELEECTTNVTIRSNIVIILGDLCRRYPNLVDRHMDSISSCCADPSVVVRRNTVILLTNLLQEEYIKWSPLMFVRYLMCAVDPCEEINNLVRYALKDIFAQKNKGLFHGQFVECMFALNECSHPKYQTQSVSPANMNSPLYQSKMEYIKRITGSSSQAAALRKALYEILLAHMDRAKRLEVTNKLCKDILAAILEEDLPLPKSNAPGDPNREETDQLLCDCFVVLCSPKISVKSDSTSQTVVETGGDNSTAPTSRLVQEGLKVVSVLERKNLSSNVLPVVLEFYQFLRGKHSPHQRCVTGLLINLMKSYKEEMIEAIGADRTLLDEIKYELEQFKKHEEEKAERDQQKILQTAQKKRRSSGFMPPPTTSGKHRRRVSGVTFVPSAKDTAPRSSSGVLKTPIPRSTVKKRRQSVSLAELSRLHSSAAPKINFSERKISSEQRRSRPHTAKRSILRSSPLEPSPKQTPSFKKNLANQLMALS